MRTFASGADTAEASSHFFVYESDKPCSELSMEWMSCLCFASSARIASSSRSTSSCSLSCSERSN